MVYIIPQAAITNYRNYAIIMFFLHSEVFRISEKNRSPTDLDIYKIMFIERVLDSSRVKIVASRKR
jgi:hypothetical protein